MTDAELYNLIVTVALITGVVFLAISVILFFRLKILKVIGDLTGRSAKQGVKKRNKEDVMKRREQELQVAQLKEAKANKKQAKKAKTEKISETEVLESNETVVLAAQETEVLGSAETDVLSSPETEVLGCAETDVLSYPETEVLGGTSYQTKTESSNTEQLDRKDAITEQLSGGATEILSETIADPDLVIEDNITVINTDITIDQQSKKQKE